MLSVSINFLYSECNNFWRDKTNLSSEPDTVVWYSCSSTNVLGHDIVYWYDFVLCVILLCYCSIINIWHSVPNINKALWEKFVKLTSSVHIPAVLLILYTVNLLSKATDPMELLFILSYSAISVQFEFCITCNYKCSSSSSLNLLDITSKFHIIIIFTTADIQITFI